MVNFAIIKKSWVPLVLFIAAGFNIAVAQKASVAIETVIVNFVYQSTIGGL